MSKSKMIWNIGLFLLAIMLLPMAYAQTAGSAAGGIIVVLINAAVIFVVLFIRQAMLVPNKEGKEKTSMWLIIIIASLVIAWVYGRGGYIWNSGPLAQFFNLYILGNTVLIGAVLYFLASFLMKDKMPKSPEGSAGMIILVAIVSFIFAFKIGNRWVWQQETISLLMGYLFGPQGILNPNWGLWVFVGASVLLTFFFNGYLLKEQNGIVNYAMAMLIASSMASSGVSIRSVIIMGEVIFTIVLASAMGAGAGDVKNPKWILAIILVGWASAAATYGTEYQGILAWLIGSILYWMGLITVPAGTAAAAAGAAAAPGVIPGGWSWKWILGAVALALILGGGAIFGGGTGVIGFGAILLVLGLLVAFVPGIGFGAFIILGIVIAILWGVMRGENRKRILTLAKGGLWKRLSVMFPERKLFRSVPERREPQVIRENKHIFQALANYVTRSEITFRYWSVVKTGIEVARKLYTDEIKEFHDKNILRKEIIAYRSGGDIDLGNRTLTVEGWNRLNVQVVDMINELYGLMTLSHISSQYELKPAGQYQVEAARFIEIEKRAIELKIKIETENNQYKRRLKAFGAHNVFQVYRDIILDMANPTGEVEEHPFKFARPGVEFNMGDFTPHHPVTNPTGKKSHATKDENGLGEEVNQYGEVVADIKEQKDELGRIKMWNPNGNYIFKRPRRVKNAEDIMDFPDFLTFLTYLNADWKGHAEDIRYGLHHPKSRSHSTYVESFRSKKMYPEWDDENIPFTNPSTKEDPALDLRAMSDLSRNNYWGRKHYFDIDTERGIPRDNPFPALSSLGLTHYLKFRIEQEIPDEQEREKWLYKWPGDSGVPDKKLPNEPVGVRLGEAKKVGGQ
jgi:hypothetical protein